MMAESSPCKIRREVCSTSDSVSKSVHTLQEASNIVSVDRKPILDINFEETLASICTSDAIDSVLDTSVHLIHADNVHVHETENSDHGDNKYSSNEAVDDEHEITMEEEFNFLDSNEALDAQFEEIFNALSEETKEKNPDILADETDSVIYDVTATSHFAAVVCDNIEACKEKEARLSEDPYAKPLYPDAPHTLGVTILFTLLFFN